MDPSSNMEIGIFSKSLSLLSLLPKKSARISKYIKDAADETLHVYKFFQIIRDALSFILKTCLEKWRKFLAKIMPRRIYIKLSAGSEDF
jgi:hypothetical protein